MEKVRYNLLMKALSPKPQKKQQLQSLNARIEQRKELVGHAKATLVWRDMSMTLL